MTDEEHRDTIRYYLRKGPLSAGTLRMICDDLGESAFNYKHVAALIESGEVEFDREFRLKLVEKEELKS